MKLDILYRTCSRVNTFTGHPRFINVPKSEVIIRCLNSLLNSCSFAQSYDISITVLDDNSDEETILALYKLLKKYSNISSKILNIEGTGNGASLKANFEYARKNCQELIYFCEDDYLHDSSAIKEMLDTYYEIIKYTENGLLIIHPCDYPDRYREPYDSLILPGSKRHWRTVMHTTGTILLPIQVLENYCDNFIALANYGIDPKISEDNTINMVYRKIMCISPIPSLTVHLQYKSTLSPFIDWQKWWDKNKVY